MRYRCADDYGISRLALVARSAAGERRWALPLAAGARSAGGEYDWDLGPLGAEPGEVVSGFVEAADNDTISGPKVGASAVVRVRIADPREKREQTRETMEKLAEDLLQLLGEELDLQARYQELEEQAGDWEKFPWQAAEEAAALQKSARESAARAEERAARLAEAMERDPGAREESILQAEMIQQGLAELRERQLAPMQEVAASLEPAGATPEEAQQKTGFLAAAAEQAARKAEDLALMAEAMKRERGMADVERGRRRWPGPRSSCSTAWSASPRATAPPPSRCSSSWSRSSRRCAISRRRCRGRTRNCPRSSSTATRSRTSTSTMCSTSSTRCASC